MTKLYKFNFVILAFLFMASPSFAERFCEINEIYHPESSSKCRGKKITHCKGSGGIPYVECPQQGQSFPDLSDLDPKRIPIPIKADRRSMSTPYEPIYRSSGHIASNFLPINSPKTDDFFESLAKSSRASLYGKRKRTRKKAGEVMIEISKIPVRKVGGATLFMCGAEHIRHDRAYPWANPISACMLMGAIQEWRKSYCPSNHPDCRVLIGDITYGPFVPEYWPHNSHREGFCFDIWPMRKNDVGRKEVTIFDDEYSQRRTQRFVEILHKWGSDTPEGEGDADQFFFNDLKIRQAGLAKRLGNHDDHIHVCFRPSEVNRARCENTQFDLHVCPTLKSGAKAKEKSQGWRFFPFDW